MRRTESWNDAAESEILQSRCKIYNLNQKCILIFLWFASDRVLARCCRIRDFAEQVFYRVRRTESWHGAAESEILQSRLIFLRPLFGFLRVSPWAVSLCPDSYRDCGFGCLFENVWDRLNIIWGKKNQVTFLW